MIRLPALDLVGPVSSRRGMRCGQCPPCLWPQGVAHPCFHLGVRRAVHEFKAAELALMDIDDESTQLRYASALAGYVDVGGYSMEAVWDQCCIQALGVGFEAAQWREVRHLSGGEQKRLALEALLRGNDEVLLLDEPDNYLDVAGKVWLERSLRESTKTVLLISHDRELLARAIDRIITVELGAAGNTVWVHGGSFATYQQARTERFARRA
jgi:ATPase subunit of ABC transporter with duplicated ATPase domains